MMKDEETTATVSFRLKETQATRKLRQAAELSLHFQNCLILLRDRLWREGQQELARHFLDPNTVRALAWQQKGGKKSDLVASIKNKLTGTELFDSLVATGGQLKDKNLRQLVKKVAGAYQSYWTKSKKGEKARPPKARKLSTIDVQGYSFPVDMECISFKQIDTIKLNLRRGTADVFTFPHDPLLKVTSTFGAIQQVEVVIKHDSVYLHFNYKKPSVSHPELPLKVAGIDLGVANILAWYVDDGETPSTAVDGAFFNAYNRRFNHRLDQLKSARDKAKQEKNKSKVKHYQKRIHKLLRDRMHFYRTNFPKLAKRVVEELARQGVTCLVLAKNLTALKNKPGYGMGRRQNRRFYPIPYDLLLRYLRQTAYALGLAVEEVDEAYTSKASALGGDPLKAQALRSQGVAKSSADFMDALNGRRVKRSQFRDRTTGVIYHSDVGGACNHIRVFVGQLAVSPHAMLWKLANPRRVGNDAIRDFLDHGMVVLARKQDRQGTFVSEVAAPPPYFNGQESTLPSHGKFGQA